jgi:hypothetical protein
MREPAANIASVLANPMPDAAPVTAATLPSNSLAIGLHLAGSPQHAPQYSNPKPVVGDKDGLSLGGVPRRKHPGRAAPPSLKSTHFFEVKSGVSNILSFAPELDRAGPFGVQTV